MPQGHAGPPPPATRFGDVRRTAEVDSTNRVAADLARAGVAEGLVIVADHQSQGRGRQGRSWDAPPGSSLLVSVVLRPADGGGHSPLATIACALAAADACGDAAGFTPELKWPNDLVAGGRKLAGVLAEVVDGGGPGTRAVVVGLGLNVSWPGPFPPELAGTATTAAEVAGRPVDRHDLLRAYLVRLEDRWSDVEAGGARTLADYRRRCSSIGRAVRVALPGGRELRGVATGVDDDGSLLLATAGTVRTVTAGDVVHLR